MAQYSMPYWPLLSCHIKCNMLLEIAMETTFLERDDFGHGHEGALTPIERGSASDPALMRVAVRSMNRIVIVQVADIIRLDAEDNYVRIWTDRPHLHKETLTGLMARLDPAKFLRIHRSHAVNLDAVRELKPLSHGEYLIVLCDSTELMSSRTYKRQVHQAFALD
jgi:DNA-binding LytR/AlgR family response regulator